MEMQRGDERYWTTFFEERKDGLAGFRLCRESHGKTDVAAEVIFWDATGGFTIETFGRDLQVEVAEAAIKEARERIKTK